METNVHIVYPKTGIEFSQLKKIFAIFEEGCKLYRDIDSPFEEGKVVKVESGSIWLEVVLPVTVTVLPLFVNFISSKLCNKKSKKRTQIEIEDNGRTIRINIEE